MDINARIASELGISRSRCDAAIGLIDEGNTIPFIARYRKEATGSLTDEQLRTLYERLTAYRALDERRADILRLIEAQGKLTPEITDSAERAQTLAELEDIYRPYRPKRRTRASVAAEAGLTPLAEILLAQNGATVPESAAEAFINSEKGIETAQKALAGAMDIIAERISDDAAVRKWVRETTYRTGRLVTKAKKEEDSVYRLYYDYLSFNCGRHSSKGLSGICFCHVRL